MGTPQNLGGLYVGFSSTQVGAQGLQAYAPGKQDEGMEKIQILSRFGMRETLSL